MLSALLKKKDSRVRKNILRGVFEENLRIVSNKPRLKKTHPLLFLGNRILIGSIFVILILGFWGSHEISSEQDRQSKTISPVGKTVSTPIVQVPFAGAADYRDMINNKKIPLSSVFGLDVKTIMLDPGHGGADSGTIGQMGTMEKEIVLDIARRLRKRLEKYGQFNVLMTRDGDVTVPLNSRVETSRLRRADLFVSVHLNYLPQKPINIIETYYFGAPSDDKGLKIAQRENAESHYSLKEFKEIIEKIGDTIKFQESKALAQSIQNNLFINTRRVNSEVLDFGVKTAPFVVLLGVDVPSVLAEVSCMSNLEEEKKLKTESHRENIASYLEAGILDYLKKGDKLHDRNEFASK